MREPIPTWYFALVLVRRGDQFVLVREPTRGQPWGLPGGRVEPGESLIAGAAREVREEAGIEVALEGILKIQHTAYQNHARVRALFVARPRDDQPLKELPDKESLMARWYELRDLDKLTLRGPDVARIAHAVLTATAPIYPLGLIGSEHDAI